MSATILLLEDDLALQDLLREVLQDEGYDVVAADSLPQLLAAAPQHADLLITDLLVNFQLVGLQAIESARLAIRNDLPALVCTAAQRQVEMQQSEFDRLRAQLLYKPFTIDELVDTVSRMLSGTDAVERIPAPSAPAAPSDALLLRPVLRASFA